jgi:hypothetical protein
MPRGKGRGGSRKSQNVTSFGSDVEMKDAGLTRNQHPQSKAKDSSFKPKHEFDRRGRVAKASPSPQAGGNRGRGGANVRTRARGNKQRLSIISTASTTLSAQRAEPWCDKCSRLNRQLHGYLLDILKDGENAIGDWAYAVGASPDHMECEPAPERIIPEGYRRCSRQHHPYTPRTEGVAGTAMPLLPPSGCTRIPFPSGLYQGKLENTPCQGSTGISPFSHLGPGVDFAQRTNDPLAALAGVNLQARHTLVAIPEHGGLQDQRPRPPSQTQLPAPQPLQPPWSSGFERPVAMYPNSNYAIPK